MSTISVSGIDAVILAIYLGVTFYLGIMKRSNGGAADFILAGRRVTLPAFVASLVSTWYGGILGVGEFTYRYGIANWLVFGVPYYLYALIFALFLARRARRTAFYTIPDQLERSYGRRTSIVGAVYIFIFALPAPYLLMLGTLIVLFFPMPLWLAIVIGAAYSYLYIARNGFAAVVRTDMFQFILMFAGFITLLVFAVSQYGGITTLSSNLPSTHLQWHGGNSPQYILAWYVIAASTLIDPNFYQRCYAAKSERTARAGILISILFWILFDFLTTTTGLYARVLLPELGNPVESYPMLAEKLLPNVAKGLFFVALFATIMSTLDSYAFVSGITLGRDVISKLRGKIGDADGNAFVRIGLAAAFVLSIGLTLLTRSVIDLWYQLGSIATPALTLPLLASFSQRWQLVPRLALASMVCAGGISLLWLLASLATGSNLAGIEPIYPGFVVSALFLLFGKKQR